MHLFRRVSRVPFDGLRESFVEGGVGAEAKGALGGGDVQAAAGLAVGFGGVPEDLAAKAGEGADLAHEILDADLKAGADVDGVAAVVTLRGEQDRFGAVFHEQEFASRCAVAPHRDRIALLPNRFGAFANQRRNHVARFGIEVVARSVKIHRQQKDRVVIVLLPVRLRLHQQHLFRQSVGRVRFFGISVPEACFVERHGSEFRITANRTHRDELRDAMLARLFDQVHAHNQVVVKKLAGVFAVRSDASHAARQMQDQRWLLFAIHPDDVFRDGQIARCGAGNVNGFASGRFQFFDDVRPEKTGAAGDDDTLIGPEGVHVNFSSG